MKNKTILAIIIIIISVLVGLSIIYYVSSSITFTRKKECSKLRVQIEEYILKHRTDDLDNAQRYVGLDEVFYSPKLNSCMYTMVRWFSDWDPNEKTFLRKEEYTLVDALTNETIAEISGWFPKIEQVASPAQARVEFNEIVAKYK